MITGNLANSADSLKSEVTGSLLCVQGGSAAVRLEVRQTTVAATLSALFAAYQVSYRSFIQLDEERDGKYEGPLRYVISRVLEGYNYVIKQNNSNIEVIIFNKKGKQATLPIVVQASKDRGVAQSRELLNESRIDPALPKAGPRRRRSQREALGS